MEQKNYGSSSFINISGKEFIYQNKKLVYQAIYAGGVVDQRKGD